MFSFIKRAGFKTHNAQRVKSLQSFTPAFRAFSNFSSLSLSDSLPVYREAISIHDSEDVSVEDTINKGFAYLISDKRLFSWSAWECFNKAIERDVKKEYEEEIACGMRLARGESGDKCYRLIKKDADGTIERYRVPIDDGVTNGESTCSANNTESGIKKKPKR